MTLHEEEEFRTLKRIQESYGKRDMSTDEIQKVFQDEFGSGWASPYQRMRQKDLISFTHAGVCSVSGLGWQTLEYYKSQKRGNKISRFLNIGTFFTSLAVLVITFFLLNWKTCSVNHKPNKRESQDHMQDTINPYQIQIPDTIKALDMDSSK